MECKLYRLTQLTKKHKQVTEVHTEGRIAAFEVLADTDEVSEFRKKHPNARCLLETYRDGRWCPVWSKPSIESYSRWLHEFNKREANQ